MNVLVMGGVAALVCMAGMVGVAYALAGIAYLFH